MIDQNKTNISNQKNIEDDEIDLIALAKTLWNGRRTVIKTTLIFMGIGLFVAIFSEKEYTAYTTFMPQTSDSKIGGSIGGLAAMAGINLGGMNSDAGISPSLYPQILNSIPFQKELLQTPLTIEGEKDKVTFANYYTEIYRSSLLGYIKKYTIGLPGIILKAIKPVTVIQVGAEGTMKLQSVTEEERLLIELLDDKVGMEINEKDGYITIYGKMPEALASAQLTKRVQELLQGYIINFKIQKSKEQLIFVQERFNEKESEFYETQMKLANFRDQNQNVNTAIAQTKLEALQSEYDLAYSVYLELAKQLETQLIQVEENTPVFTILKPVMIPIEKSKPRRFLILFVWIILGGITGLSWIFVKDYLVDFRRNWDKNACELESDIN